MVHFGILCPASTSHLNTMLPLAQELKERGHRLTAVGLLDTKARAQAAGLDFQAIGLEEYPIGSTATAMSELGKLSGMTAVRYTIYLFQLITNINLRDAPTCMKALGIEAFLCDQAFSEGATIAEFLDVPFVNICSAAVLNQEPGVPPCVTPWRYRSAVWAYWRNRAAYAVLDWLTRPILECINEYRKGWGFTLQTQSDEGYSQIAQISHQPAEFEFPRQSLPQCFHFTGPFQSQARRDPIAFPYEELTGQPLIYASLGTILSGLPHIFQQIAEACLGLDAQLVISLGGGASPDSLSQLPGNPLVVDYAPQLELLKRAALMITAAGMNSTLESLSNAVPLVAIPITNDQPGIAARIAWTGTGEAISLGRLNASRLRNAIQRVLTQDVYKQNALKLQAAINQSGGVRQAADIIEQAIATGEPVIA